MPNKTQYWAEAYNLAFLPLSQATNAFMRNFETAAKDIEKSHPISLCALVDSLSLQAKTETLFALENLQSKGSYCINLQGQNANLRSVKSLLKYIPLDICLFAAHGTESSLALVDGFLASDEVRALSVLGRPFVINNSCLSWTGLGEAFIEGQARGFIGTYWTIENDIAMNIAQELIVQLLEGKPASQVLKDAVRKGNQSLTHLAYIFVGVHNAKLFNGQPSSVEEMQEVEGLVWAMILRLAGDVANYRQDPSAAKALWRIVPPIDEIVGKNKISQSLVDTIAIAGFDLLLGLSKFEAHEQITIDHVLEQGKRAVEAIQQRGTNGQLYRVLSQLGDVYLQRNQIGDHEQAEECFFKALEIERQLGNRQAEARELGNIGILYETKGNYTKSIEYHQQALAINKEFLNTRDQIIDLQNIALMYLKLQDVPSGLDYAHEALRLHNSVADYPEMRLSFSIKVGEGLVNNGRCVAAEEFIETPLHELFEKMQHKEQKLSRLDISWMMRGLACRAWCAYHAELWAEAEQLFASIANLAMAIKKFPEYFSTQINRIILLKKMSNLREAHVLLNEIILKFDDLEENMDKETYESFAQEIAKLNEDIH